MASEASRRTQRVREGGTKGQMDQELRDFLLAMESRLDSKLAEVKARLMAHSEAVETRLLTEFWKWARTSDIKARHHSFGISFEERLTVVEERLRDIEFRRPA
jgi:hypothetical protein